MFHHDRADSSDPAAGAAGLGFGGIAAFIPAGFFFNKEQGALRAEEPRGRPEGPEKIGRSPGPAAGRLGGSGPARPAFLGCGMSSEKFPAARDDYERIPEYGSALDPAEGILEGNLAGEAEVRAAMMAIRK